MRRATSPASTPPTASQRGGKIRRLALLDLDGPVYVLGDGYTDYEIRQAGLAHRFYAYTENVEPPQRSGPRRRRAADL